MRHLRRAMRSLLLAAACASAIAGCRPWDWRGQEHDDRTRVWTKDLRPAADESRLSGVDAKARDIERNLGVR